MVESECVDCQPRQRVKPQINIKEEVILFGHNPLDDGTNPKHNKIIKMSE